VESPSDFLLSSTGLGTSRHKIEGSNQAQMSQHNSKYEWRHEQTGTVRTWVGPISDVDCYVGV